MVVGVKVESIGETVEEIVGEAVSPDEGGRVSLPMVGLALGATVGIDVGRIVGILVGLAVTEGDTASEQRHVVSIAVEATGLQICLLTKVAPSHVAHAGVR